MTPALILRSMEDALTPLVRAEGGDLSVSDTPEDTLDLLMKSPAKWRCVLQWEGHKGDDGTMGSSKRGRIAVILQSAKGLHIDRGRDVHRSRSGERRPLMELVSLVNNWIRATLFTDDETGDLLDDVETIKSKGRRQVFSEEDGEWLAYEGVEVRSYQTTHSLRYADRSADDEVRTIAIAVETPFANIVRREIVADGDLSAFAHEDIRRVYLVFLNGVSVAAEHVTLDGDTAVFSTVPQPGDVVMLVGAN